VKDTRKYESPLHWALKGDTTTDVVAALAIFCCKPRTIKLLLARGASVGPHDDGVNILHMGARFANAKVFNVISSSPLRGITANNKDADENTGWDILEKASSSYH
jgi:hypothetical protein